MAESNRDKQLNTVMTDTRRLGNQISNLDLNVNNRWDSFKPTFDYERQKKGLDALYNEYSADLNKTAENDKLQAQRDISQRLLSQGIGSGSIYNNNINNVNNAMNKNLLQARQGLQTDKTGKVLGLQDNQNRMDMFRTSQAQNIDFENVNNILRKYGLLTGNQQMQNGLANSFDDTTWFDDVLGVVNTGANILSIPGLLGEKEKGK